MIKKAYTECSEGQVHYRECGEGNDETICFFHQTASSGVMFEKVMAALAKDFHCYSFDSPGFGQSYQPEEIPNLGYITDRLMEAIETLGIKQFHACGHHTGGCVAVEMPVRYKELVQSLTIIGPVLVNEEERREYMKTFVRPFAIEESGDFLKGAWEYLRMIGAGSNVHLHTREMADHLIAHDTMAMAFSAVWEQDFESFFKSVKCPLMIMCSEDDVLWPLFERAGNLRPDAKQAIVAGGDFQPDNDPNGVAAALWSFLSDLN